VIPGDVVLAQPGHEPARTPFRGGGTDVGKRTIVLAAQPGVQRARADEAELEREHGEAAPFGQESQNALAHRRELLDEVGALTDRHNTCIADDLPQGLEIVQRSRRVDGGQNAGVIAHPGGRCNGMISGHNDSPLWKPLFAA
jgi:hypothetical protein